HRFTSCTVDLIMEEEVRREPLEARRVDTSLIVPDGQTGDCRLAIFVEKAHWDLDRWLHIEEDRDFSPKPKVLRSLADVKLQGRFAFSRVAAREDYDHIFKRGAAQVIGHRSIGVDLGVEPALVADGRRHIYHRSDLSSADAERSGNTAFVL